MHFIADVTLEAIVKEVLSKGCQAVERVNKNFGRNVIDPFLMLFELSSFETDFVLWEKNERQRQVQKTLTNAIGDFHQKILG